VCAARLSQVYPETMSLEGMAAWDGLFGKPSTTTTPPEVLSWPLAGRRGTTTWSS